MDQRPHVVFEYAPDTPADRNRRRLARWLLIFAVSAIMGLIFYNALFGLPF